MKEIIKGHLYELDNLHSDTTTLLPFYMDPKLHDGQGQPGPSTQEVIRACIARIEALDDEVPSVINALLIQHGRMMIALFEARALLRKVEKGDLKVERLPLGKDGHIQWVV